MAGLFSKFFVSCVITISFICSIPATTTYERPKETGTAIIAEITSYNSVPAQTDDTPFITASGTHVHDGTIACPYEYAFGTTVSIEGKKYTCEDRMNRKYPDRFDVWLANTASSSEWGIKTMRIIIN